MVDQIVRGRFQSVQEADQTGVGQALDIGHQHKFIIGRHAVFLGEEGAARPADDVHLVEFEVAEGPDDRVHLPGQDGRRQAEVDVDQGDVLKAQAGVGQHGAQKGILEPADGIAHGAALQVGQRADGAIGQHHHRVQGRGDQRGDADQRQAPGDLNMQLWLIRHRQVRLAGGDQLGRVVGIGRGDQLDLQALGLEKALVARHHQGGVVGVHEPVQQHGQGLGLGPRGQGGQEHDGGGKCGQTAVKGSH